MSAIVPELRVIPEVTDQSFHFDGLAPLEERTINPDAPLSFTAQARVLDYAMQTHPNASPVFAEVAHHLAQAAVAAPGPVPGLRIEELPLKPAHERVVFREEDRIVVGATIDAPTAGVLDLTVSDVQAVQEGIKLARQLPASKRQGSGAEVLKALPPTERGIAVHALRAVAARKTPDYGLLTHDKDQLEAGAAGHFGDEAAVMLRSAGYRLPMAVRTRELWRRVYAVGQDMQQRFAGRLAADAIIQRY